MKLYRVSAPYADAPNNEVAKWVGTQADAAKARTDLIDTYGARRKHISTEKIEVPTTKAELIAWFNERGV